MYDFEKNLAVISGIPNNHIDSFVEGDRVKKQVAKIATENVFISRSHKR